MSARDDAHEALIKAAFESLMDAACRESKQVAFEHMRELIKARTPERIRELEIARGLRAP